MCNTTFSADMEPVATFAGLDFLRNHSRLILPNSENHLMLQIPKERPGVADRGLRSPTEQESSKSPILDVTESISLNSGTDTGADHDNVPNENTHLYPFQVFNGIDNTSMPRTGATLFKPANSSLPLGFPNLTGVLPVSKTQLPAFEYIAPPNHAMSTSLDFPLMELNRVGGMFPGFMQRRQRGEKRPIPEEQKDEKYYERRKRNNEAAKKSRDARKIREDRIALRAALLEQENSILRAQVLALRDELQTVRQLMAVGRGTAGL